MNRVLVTGATGHLGKSVTRALVNAGIPVLAVARRADALAALKETMPGAALETAVADLAVPASIAAIASQFGPLRQIIHLAAQVDAAATLDQHMSGNLLATVSLVGALREHLEQIVYLSSIEVYGTPQTVPMHESHPTTPTAYYGAGKLAAEKFLQVFAMERGATVTSLRCASIYGPGETIRRATTVFLQNAARGKALQIAGDGTDLRDYIYVEDCANAVVRALHARKPGVFNLGGGAPLSIADMAQIVMDVSGKDLPIVRGERTKPKYDLALDITKICAEIGWTPATTMQEGLAAEYRSFLNVSGL